MMKYPDNCPHCNLKIIRPMGKRDSKVLVIGEAPSWQETMSLTPFDSDAGEIMRNEFGLVGISMDLFRVTNMWLHEKSKNKDCQAVGVEWAIREAEGKEAIFLVGNDTCKFFLGHPALEVCGLKVTSQYFPDVPLIMACVNPSTAISGKVGEIRLAVTRFSKLISDLME